MGAGTVVLINLGTPPDEVKGHEQAFSRPCVVIRDFPQAGLLTVIPITSKQSPFPDLTVPLPAGEGGLTMDSLALCYQIRTVSTRRVIKQLGTLSDKAFEDIWLGITHYFGS